MGIEPVILLARVRAARIPGSAYGVVGKTPPTLPK